MMRKNIRLILLITLITAPILSMDNKRKAAKAARAMEPLKKHKANNAVVLSSSDGKYTIELREEITKLPPAKQALLSAIPVTPLHNIILGYLDTWALDYRYDHDDLGANISAVCYSPDGKFITTTDDLPQKKTKTWDIAQKKIVSKICAESQTDDAAYSENGKYLAARMRESNAAIYNLNDNVISDVQFKINDPANITAIDFSPDSQYLVTGGTRSLKIYSVLSSSLIYTKDSQSKIFSIQFSPDNNYIAIGLDGSTQIFDIKSKVVTIILRDILANQTHVPIICLVFSEDSKYLTTVCKKGSLSRWDLKTGLCVKNLKIGSINFAKQSPNRKYLLMKHINSNKLFMVFCIRDAQTLELLYELEDINNLFGACSNTAFATTRNNKVTIWKNQALEIQAEK